jgi:rhodanese-related sulfurtransferase
MNGMSRSFSSRALSQAWSILIAMAAAGAPAGAANSGAPNPHSAVAPDTAAVARVGVPQAMLAVERGEAVLIDVRPEGQRRLGHIRGDVSVPIEDLSARQPKLPRDRTLIFYCSCPAEELALEAARDLIQAGDRRVAVLVGGFDAWRGAQGPVEMAHTWEEVFQVDETPSGWGKTPIDTVRCRYARDAGIAAHGAASGRISCVPDSVAHGFAGFSQRIDPRLCRGRMVVLSAVVRTEQVGRGAFLFVGAQDEEGKFIAMSQSPPDSLAGTRGWREVEVRGVVPVQADKVLIGLSLVGAGRVWLDDVRLVAPDMNGQPRVRMVVANPGFEE